MRYAVQLLIHERVTPWGFPWATFTVNIVGSFLIGLFYVLSAKMELPDTWRLFLTAGLCGGFTTFSTFSSDNLELLRQGEWWMFAVYGILSFVLGIIACLAGGWAGGWQPK